VCDGDIDGDGCANLYDPKLADISDPDEACLSRPLDPAFTRAGRLMELDPRLDDPRLHVLLEGIRPEDPATCGELDCPPPTVNIFDKTLTELLVQIRAKVKLCLSRPGDLHGILGLLQQTQSPPGDFRARRRPGCGTRPAHTSDNL
jgi:hypothetical protein